MLKRALERFQQNPIKRTLIQINLVTTGIALILASVILIADEMVFFRRSLIDNLTIQAKIIGNSSADNLLFNAAIEAEADLASLEKSKSVAVAVIYNRDGTVFATYHRDGARNGFIPPAPQGDGYESGINRLSVYRQIFLEDARLGTIYIEADFKEFYIRLIRYLFLEVVVIALSLSLAFFLLSTLHRTITNPLRELVELMRGVSKDKNYTARLAIHSRNELGALAESFNDMLSQIQERDAELDMHRKHLEEEVSLRTAELALTNEQLQQELLEKRIAERKLERYAAELKQSNEDVLSFAYIVSHDLRAPLVSIMGFAGELQLAVRDIDTVLDRCLPHLSEQERGRITAAYRNDVPEAVKFINSSAIRMDGQIGAILTLSRLGRRELRPGQIDMRALTETILSSLAHQIEQRKTVVTIGELPTVIADKTAMEQIMGNLLDNALKYLDPARNGEIAISADQGAEEITVHVRDNGRGIAGEDIQKVFEMFRRAGQQNVPGEGMGLAYVKALVRRHGGRIWCESELGVGTTFSFTLSRQGKAPGEQEDAYA